MPGITAAAFLIINIDELRCRPICEPNWLCRLHSRGAAGDMNLAVKLAHGNGNLFTFLLYSVPENFSRVYL